MHSDVREAARLLVSEETRAPGRLQEARGNMRPREMIAQVQGWEEAAARCKPASALDRMRLID